LGLYGLKKDFGIILQTQDRKYRAYIYLKVIGTGTITIGVKRLKIM